MKMLGNAGRSSRPVRKYRTLTDLFNLDVGRYPNEEEGENIDRTTRRFGSLEWSLLKSNEVPKDPWGGVYVYTTPGMKGKPYSLKSYGADRLLGEL